MQSKPVIILGRGTDNHWNDGTRQSIAFDLWNGPECDPANTLVAVCTYRRGCSISFDLAQMWNGRCAQLSLCNLQARAGRVC